MLSTHLTRVESQLKQVIAPSVLRALGDQSGFVIRKRSITADRFVPSIIKSLGSRDIESLADLVRDFNHDHGLAINYKPFYERLDTPCFPRLMHGVLERMLTHLCISVLKPLRDGPFARFKDIIAHDGSSFALHDALAPDFPGRFTTVSPAAVELHCSLSLLSDSLVSVTLTGDSECERHHAPDPKDLRNKLLLCDRGYDGTTYMEAIDAAGGSFLIRARKCHDPLVLKIHRRGKRFRSLEGRKLSYVLKHTPKDVVQDLDVCWERQGEQRYFFRLVASWNSEKKQWMRLLTNLPREEFSAMETLQTYRLRWQVELIFKEMKSYANLHRFGTRKENIAEGLIWAALCAALLKRYLAHACQRVLGTVAISTRRTAMCGAQILNSLCRCISVGFRGLNKALQEIFDYLGHNARRANIPREKKRGRMALGLQLAGVRNT
jgi:hypothetical protein